MYDYDLLTIGAGSGGVAGSRRAAEYGARVAIVEAGRVGGTCVLRGCVPKKLLVYGARFRDEIEDARGFGWTIDGARHDWGRLIETKNRELVRLEGIYEQMLANSGVTVLRGRGRVTGPHEVEVDGRTVTAENILIATGSHPYLPKIPGIEHVITSDEALDLPALPGRIVIIGGGYIATEFASILSTLGAATTLVLRSEQILRGFDGDVREAVAGEMAARGIDFRRHVEPVRIDRLAEGFAVTLTSGEVLETDLVMFATGRVPNTAALGLDAIGIHTRDNGAIVVNDRFETHIRSIHAVGDVTDRFQLTPVAIAEARSLAERLYNDNGYKLRYDTLPTAVFCTPQIGTVGLTEEAARRMYASIRIFRARFRPMKHTLTGRETRILMKLVVDAASDRVLGAHMVGDDAAEIIQSLAVAITCGATKKQFDETIALHPSAAEEFVTMRAPATD
ncbi:glutathione-disulfide reductase [Tistrella bauzanensis]|uniref:Glutathione reductase n=1 Tax=Tistrella arctica TaxID=3133430 RepID=A0ABU9YD84_9PROT